MAAVTALEKFELRFVRPTQGRTLIVGSKVYPGRVDRRSRFADAVGVDMLPGEGVDVVCNMEEWEEAAGLGLFEHVECLSVLEHSRQPWKLAENIERLMKPGATLFVAAPFVHEFHGYPDDYFRFTTRGLQLMFPSLTFEAVGLAHQKLTMKDRLGRFKFGGYPFFPRCEAVGFARR